jgi:hypothetical protein
MAQDNYRIAKLAIRDLLSTLVNTKEIGNIDNKQFLIDLLLTLPEDSINALLTISILKEKYVPLVNGDTVMFKPHYASSTYDRDIMIDKGMMTPDGRVFGTVTGDGSWSSSGDFNPYYGTMKVDVFIWKDSKIDLYEENVSTFELEIIDPYDLPQFNHKSQLDFLDEVNPNSKDVSNDDTQSLDTL